MLHVCLVLSFQSCSTFKEKRFVRKRKKKSFQIGGFKIINNLSVKSKSREPHWTAESDPSSIRDDQMTELHVERITVRIS